MTNPNFLVSLYGVMHEAGHGMYEQGLPKEAFGTPAGTYVSLGIHESQSRLWENQVGRAREFWEHWLPRAVHCFPHLAARTPEEMFAAVNRVRPSFIRVEADQVTYDLHILLRFGLERRILAGELAIRDVPAAWNEDFEAMFGLKVPDDAHGCLQDIHWSEGLIGYFPTYTLGNLNAAPALPPRAGGRARAHGRTRRRPLRWAARLDAGKSPRPGPANAPPRTRRGSHRRADPRGTLPDGPAGEVLAIKRPPRQRRPNTG